MAAPSVVGRLPAAGAAGLGATWSGALCAALLVSEPGAEAEWERAGTSGGMTAPSHGVACVPAGAVRL